MRTVVLQGGWRMWLLLILGGALVLALGLVAGVILLGLLAVGVVALLGHRLLQSLGLVSRHTMAEAAHRPPAAGPDGTVDADFRVVGQRALVKPARGAEREPQAPA